MGRQSLNSLSLIVPTLNEQDCLGGLLHDIQQQRGVQIQCIVADGGSQDASRQIADQAKADWLTAARGRGAQMNAGRKLAKHRNLLFLHADSRLPDPQLLARALASLALQPAHSAGHFGLQFADAPPSARRFYRHLESKSRLNRPETIHGDQGLLITDTFFDALGGFDESLPFFEDHAISRRIFERGQWLLLPGSLQTSARRFEQEGRGARYFLMMLMMCAHQGELPEFFQQARQLYPSQQQASRLAVSPYLELIISLTQDRPDFWRAMACYTLDNAWQVAFFVDQWLQQPLLLPLHDRTAKLWPRRLLEPMLAPVLKQLFSGPILAALRQRES